MMTTDEIIDKDEVLKMAEQAGWSGIYSQWVSPTERTHLTVPVTMEQIEAFAKLVDAKATAKEREACAKVCEDKHTLLSWPTYAAAIRARGNNE